MKTEKGGFVKSFLFFVPIRRAFCIFAHINNRIVYNLKVYRTMFSGIVEECATLVAMVKDQENVHFTFKCSFVSELKIDQSVSHNGVCLTVVSHDR